MRPRHTVVCLGVGGAPDSLIERVEHLGPSHLSDLEEHWVPSKSTVPDRGPARDPALGKRPVITIFIPHQPVGLPQEDIICDCHGRESGARPQDPATPVYSRESHPWSDFAQGVLKKQRQWRGLLLPSVKCGLTAEAYREEM